MEETGILRELSQKQKHKYHKMSLTGGSKNSYKEATLHKETDAETQITSDSQKENMRAQGVMKRLE